MSYSTIKGKFHGDIQFQSQENKGTVFHLILPVASKVDKKQSNKNETEESKKVDPKQNKEIKEISNYLDKKE